MTEPKLVLMGCGDIGPLHPPVDPYAELVAPALAQADLRFANLERLYSTRGTLHPEAGGGYCRMDPKHASFIKAAGFDVLSLATNHGMDWGADALLDTAEVARSQGAITLGAGRNLHDAQAPIVQERNGVKIAFLNYCSVFRDGYAAEENTPGISPLRVATCYKSFDYQPGVPPKVITTPDEQDLERLVTQVKAARKLAHSVVISMHWGIHFVPRLLADYQQIVAHVAFEAGADLILGHHAHCAKAIEVHDGKVCFHSLGNFMMTLERTPEGLANFIKKYRPMGVDIDTDPAYEHLPYGKHGKYTLIARAEFTAQGIGRVSYIPVIINRALKPEPLLRGDPRFDEVVDFMTWVSDGYGASFSVEGNEVVITAA